MNDPISFIAMFILKNKHLVRIPEKKEPKTSEPANKSTANPGESPDAAAEASKQLPAPTPELVAAYFSEKEKSMQLEPKLSNTWIGYASFLFEVVHLPVPDHLGYGPEWAQLPPQTTILIESVLPRPLIRGFSSRLRSSR